MYKLAVKRDFIAQHRLVGGDWGAENDVHSHHYRLEMQIEGRDLDDHGFLVDIVAVETALETAIAGYREQTLNELAEFQGLNPSIEHFSRMLCLQLGKAITAENIDAITVKLWEDEAAWASYTQSLNVW
jgi:6-pyruvoyltetrahydropterin/6-carboxytetrahydropterin synthase